MSVALIRGLEKENGKLHNYFFFLSQNKEMAVELQYNNLYNNSFKNLPLYAPGKTSLKAKELPTTYDQQGKILLLKPWCHSSTAK